MKVAMPTKKFGKTTGQKRLDAALHIMKSVSTEAALVATGLGSAAKEFEQSLKIVDSVTKQPVKPGEPGILTDGGFTKYLPELPKGEQLGVPPTPYDDPELKQETVTTQDIDKTQELLDEYGEKERQEGEKELLDSLMSGASLDDPPPFDAEFNPDIGDGKIGSCARCFDAFEMDCLNERGYCKKCQREKGTKPFKVCHDCGAFGPLTVECYGCEEDVCKDCVTLVNVHKDDSVKSPLCKSCFESYIETHAGTHHTTNEVPEKMVIPQPIAKAVAHCQECEKEKANPVALICMHCSKEMCHDCSRVSGSVTICRTCKEKIDGFEDKFCNSCSDEKPPDSLYYCDGCKKKNCEGCFEYCAICDTKYCIDCMPHGTCESCRIKKLHKSAGIGNAEEIE